MYSGFAQAVELLRSSKDGTHSVSPSCVALTRGYPRLTPSELFSAQKPLFPKSTPLIVNGTSDTLLPLFPYYKQNKGITRSSCRRRPAFPAFSAFVGVAGQARNDVGQAGNDVATQSRRLMASPAGLFADYNTFICC